MEKRKECIGDKVINLHEEHGSLGIILIMQTSQRSLVFKLEKTFSEYEMSAGRAP